MAWDPRTREARDFHGGIADLRARTLRHTSPAFSEDPLRVLRGMQFVARFGLHADPKTLALCRGIAHTYDELARERVWGEWRKWAAHRHAAFARPRVPARRRLAADTSPSSRT